MIDILYRKRGRRYVAVESHRPWGSDVMKPGQVRLEVCTDEGERSYQYGIEPDKAAWHAAALLARAAMEHAIRDASIARPAGSERTHPAQLSRRSDALTYSAALARSVSLRSGASTAIQMRRP